MDETNVITTNQDPQPHQHQTPVKKTKKLQIDPRNLQTAFILHKGQQIKQIEIVLEFIQKKVRKHQQKVI